MELLVVCGQCSSEFSVSGDDRFWKCPQCGHDVENMQYPFLSRKVAHAKAHHSEAIWETMFDELLREAREKVIHLQARVRLLEEDNRRLKAEVHKKAP